MRLLTAAVGLVLASSLAAPIFASELGNQSAVVAHEWGTFTSVAAPDGSPVEWSTLVGPPDLPCFVQRGPARKTDFSSLVRMETPVLYFYSSRSAELSVKVPALPLGSMTEWYPKATDAGNSLRWDSIKLDPAAHPDLPASKNASRYFAARNTDSTPLNVGGQWEKMLFYRGVGSFAIPLYPKFTADGKIEVRNVSQDGIPLAILFENHDGKLGYRIESDMTGTSTIDLPDLTGDIGRVRAVIVKALIERGGLYPKEAQAMMDTWQDSWFEEGARLIYILPQRPVDALLPLTITPVPSELTRAFVGRIELLSPAMKREIEIAATAGDEVALKKYGRFLSAFAHQMPGLAATAAYRGVEQKLEQETGNVSPASCVP